MMKEKESYYIILKNAYNAINLLRKLYESEYEIYLPKKINRLQCPSTTNISSPNIHDFLTYFP